jgi:hypothetical protein
MVETTANLPLIRDNDKYIMEEFYRSGQRGQALFRLNCCRMYLQVTTVSDITTGDGYYITQYAWMGQFDHHQTSRYEWPRQPRPTDWSLWRSALNKAIGVAPRSRRLNHLAYGSTRRGTDGTTRRKMIEFTTR